MVFDEMSGVLDTLLRGNYPSLEGPLHRVSSILDNVVVEHLRLIGNVFYCVGFHLSLLRDCGPTRLLNST